VLFQRAWKPADIVLITAVPQQYAKPLHLVQGFFRDPNLRYITA
jgi:hypothetical protein